MSAKRDMTNNTLVIPFVTHTTHQTNTGILTSNYDTMRGGANPTRMLLILLMSSWGSGGSVTVRVQDCNTSNGTFSTRATLGAANQSTGQTCFMAEVSDFRRFVRLSYDVTGAACTLSIIGICQRGRKEPVTQYDAVGKLSVSQTVAPEAS